MCHNYLIYLIKIYRHQVLFWDLRFSILLTGKDTLDLNTKDELVILNVKAVENNNEGTTGTGSQQYRVAIDQLFC